MEKNNSAERVPTLAELAAELRRAEMMALHAIETAVDVFVAASALARALARDAAGVVKEKGAAKCKRKETLQKAIAQPAASEVNPQQMDKKLEIEAVLAAVREQMRKKECAKKEAAAAKVALLAEKDDDVKLKVPPPTAAKAVAVSEAYRKRIMEGVEVAKEAAAVPRPDESGVMEQDEAETLEEQLRTMTPKLQ